MGGTVSKFMREVEWQVFAGDLIIEEEDSPPGGPTSDNKAITGQSSLALPDNIEDQRNILANILLIIHPENRRFISK